MECQLSAKLERLLRTLGIQGVRRGKVVRTTISDSTAPCPLDWYNTQRLLEPIGYIPPAEAEANYYWQFAEQEVAEIARLKPNSLHDFRGCSLCAQRGIKKEDL